MIPIGLILLGLPLGSHQTSSTMETISAASDRFGIKLCRELAPASSGNLLVSPISLTSNLRLLLIGTRGASRATLAKTLELGGQSDEKVGSGSGTFDAAITAPGESEVTVANSIWLAPGVVVKPTYAKIAREAFHATTQTLAGTGPAAAGEINSWVSEHTKGRIDKLFDTLATDVSMVLVNAVTFDGKWQSPFPSRFTRPRTFHGGGGDKDVDTMMLTDQIELAKSGDVQYVRLPYKGHASLWIALPKQGVSPDSTLQTFLALPKTDAIQAHLFLPKFIFRDSHNLVSPLSKLGMGPLFEHGNFTGISDDRRLGRVSEIVQKTYIKLDEEGTEAAAATGTIMRPTAVRIQPPMPEIHVDHPFAFAIRDDSTGALLFVGIVKDLG